MLSLNRKCRLKPSRDINFIINVKNLTNFQNAITAATEAACLVLSVDQTVKNPRTPSGGSMPGLE